MEGIPPCVIRWLAFLLLTLAFCILGKLMRGVTTSGAVAGGCVCLALLVGSGWAGFAALIGVFLLTWAATRAGYSRKLQLGEAEARSGRDAPQVLANLGVAAACSFAYAFLWTDSRLGLALAAALAEAAADTVSSEIGKAFGGIPRLITNWKPAPPGTDGAITTLGTCAGVTSAVLVGEICSLAGMFGWRLSLVPIAAGVLGMIADSLLGATLERRSLLNNNAVNFLSTAFAALLVFLTA